MFAMALTGLAVDKMKVVTVCKDVRIAMDGGYSAAILAGGIRHRTVVQVYKLHAMKRVSLGAVEVLPQSVYINGVPTEIFRASDLKLMIRDQSEPPVRGRPATLWAQVGNEKISAQMGCLP